MKKTASGFRKIIILSALFWGAILSAGCSTPSEFEMQQLAKQIVDNDRKFEQRVSAIRRLSTGQTKEALVKLENCLIELEDSDLVVFELVKAIGNYNTPDSRKVLRDFLESRKELSGKIRAAAISYIKEAEEEQKTPAKIQK